MVSSLKHNLELFRLFALLPLFFASSLVWSWEFGYFTLGLIH